VIIPDVMLIGLFGAITVTSAFVQTTAPKAAIVTAWRVPAFAGTVEDSMPTNSHTPGPWDKIVHDDKCSRVGAKTLIAVVYSEAFKDRENQEANARLIAAAPDLLEALKKFEHAATSWHEFHHGTHIECDELCACIEPATHAIAKAEGK